MEFDPDRVYKNIIYLRKKLGFTQDFVANYLAGMSRSNYAKLEKGGVHITADRLFRFSELFEVSIDDLVKKPLYDRKYIRNERALMQASEAPPPRFSEKRSNEIFSVTINLHVTNREDPATIACMAELLQLAKKFNR
jgi:transcriptional regulator with XRE-family HTH domain